jgi:hypothetical protein
VCIEIGGDGKIPPEDVVAKIDAGLEEVWDGPTLR